MFIFALREYRENKKRKGILYIIKCLFLNKIGRLKRVTLFSYLLHCLVLY